MEEFNRRSEDFLTNVSHELRTPINAVTGITAVMQQKEEDEEKKNNLMAVQQAGRRLSDQIGDILDYTEIDTGRLKLSREPYMLSSLINDLMMEIQLIQQGATSELVVDVDPRLPSSLIGDGAKMRKILRHLIDNALKFTRNGGVYVRLSGRSKSYGINLSIEVHDTGIGISEEQKQRILNHFYQADAGRARRSGGMGLGLAVVQGLVSAMGGFIHIRSEEGHGTVVRISIPQEVAESEPCMRVEKNKEVSDVCYLQPEKYSTH